MIKDKEWAQKEIDGYLSYEGVNEARNALVFAKGVINQLDEPKKPVIPQFVANYIETYKGNGFSLGTWLHFADNGDEDECDTVIWLYGGSKEEKLKREYLLLDAVRYGYEVEKDSHYYVAFEGAFNLLYVTHVDIYGKDGKFNCSSESNTTHALKFTDKSKAEYLANLIGAIVV